LNEAVEKIGVDVMRWMYITHNPATNTNFGFKLGEEVKSKLVMLYNLTNYVTQSVQSIPKKPNNLELEDYWILSKLNSLIKDVTENLDELKPHLVSSSIENFYMFDFSRNYIQFIRERIQNPNGKNKKAAEYCLYNVLTTLLKLMAPFVPFITEDIYQKNLQKLEKTESIHLQDWPKENSSLIDKKLEEEMVITQEVIQTILSLREQEKINVRWPLALAEVSVKDAKLKKAIKKLSPLIERQTNIKKIILKDLKEGSDFKYGKIKLNTEITLDLEKEGFSREIIRRIQQIRKELGLKKQDKIEVSLVSDYNLEDWKKEIQETTNSKLFFEEKKYKNLKEFEIKGKKFKISTKIL